jgi:maleate isomerase
VKAGSFVEIETEVPRFRLGMLTPSSNTVLEPVCSAILADLPEVTLHYGRFRVTEISLSEAALGQFGHAAMLQAAELLADAHVQTICWNGTSASWLGLEWDRELCATISKDTGIAATSSILSLFDSLRAAGLEQVGLVTPYTNSVQQLISDTLAAEGVEVVAERHLGISENFSFGTVSEAVIAEMIRSVAAAPSVEAVLVLCTNLRAAPLVDALEHELDVPIFDSISTAVHGALRVAGVDPTRVSGWGRLFSAFPGPAAHAPADQLLEAGGG